MSAFKHILFSTVFLALLPACGGGGGGGNGGGGGGGGTIDLAPTDPEYHLGTARFTTSQPDVLEQIGVHHAYALGLTGRGVRIGIEDSIVDYTQRGEFGNRVALRHADGADLAYPHPLAEEIGSDVDRCTRAGTCTRFRDNSRGDDEALNLWVRRIVSRDGWPTRDNSVFVVDDHFSASDLIEAFSRWSEVPTPYGDAAHGTTVASIAAGTNLGVAPGATIIPVAVDFAARQQRETSYADAVLRSVIASLPDPDRREVDNMLADTYRQQHAKFDIINRSFSIDLFDPAVIAAEIESELRWYRQYLPKTLDASLQIGTPNSRKTIIVYSAGNDGQPWSGLGADLPFYIPELRGHSLAVVATDPRTGAIADYSNHCGPVPNDWSAARHGRHYCLAAPGTVRGLVPNPNRPGTGDVTSGLRGTSYSAPLVSGSLALLKEHFRGTRGNTQIVKRMIDTADRSGRYADIEIYGAGHLDLEAALSPVGALSVGRSGDALSRTSFQAPMAFGSVARRVGSIELAAFDEQEFPFWVPLSALISQGAAGRSPIPRFEDAKTSAMPAPGLEILDLHWTGLDGDGNDRALNSGRWVMGFGPTSASLAHRPFHGGWGYGLSFDDAGHLGAETSGAFGTDPRSGMVWVSRTFQQGLHDDWTLKATGTAALSLPQYEKDAVFRASPSMMSAMMLRVGNESTGVAVEQPLRAESGMGRFRVENGRIENGKRLYDEFRVPLRPDGREVRMTLRHDVAALGGKIAMEVGAAVNAGHVQGRRAANVGLAYRATW